MKLMDRLRALEAQGWTFERRNSAHQWVRMKSNTNKRLAKLVAYVENLNLEEHHNETFRIEEERSEDGADVRQQGRSQEGARQAERWHASGAGEGEEGDDVRRRTW